MGNGAEPARFAALLLTSQIRLALSRSSARFPHSALLLYWARMITLLLATRNRHKVEEMRAILESAFRYLTLNDFPAAPEVAEDAGTFAGNATKKAVALAKWLGGAGATPHVAASTNPLLVLADDSGLEVDALNGAPGVHSARFAALDTGQPGNSPATENNAKLLRLLKEVPPAKRTARFRCVIALTPAALPVPENASPVCNADQFELETELFEGVCEGRIGFELHGKGGFGYDPLFTPEGHNQTFGELPEQMKNQLSHRAKALAALKAALRRHST
jgi:XTP/dITP diphosphohydrolase